MINIIRIYNENTLLKDFAKTEARKMFQELIRYKKEVNFLIAEFNLYNFINNLIIPLFYICHNEEPDLYMREDVEFKKRWCRFDQVFKSKQLLVHIINNEIYIERVGSKNVSDIVDFAVISKEYISFNNNKEGD